MVDRACRRRAARALRRGESRQRPGNSEHVSRGATALALLALAFHPRAFAETGPAEPSTGDSGAPKLEEVVVTGIRQSLKNSQQIKKEADVFVDSITAEDMGALPDRSVTETLQRVPGVTISRFAAGSDPDHFSVEGAGVTVRGLNYIRSELNGRDSFSADNGRGLSFADVSPELMGGVDVFKNQSAEMIEGGLAGTVNLRTRLPFDSGGRVLAGSIEANYGDFAKVWKPTASGLYSDRWETGIGRIGFLLDGVYSALATRSDGAQASNFRLRTDLVPGEEVWAPRGAAVRSQQFDHTRKGIGSAFQWENDDSTQRATLQYLRSDSTEAWTEHTFETATDLVGDTFIPVAGTQFKFGSDGVFSKGVITDNNPNWRDDQNSTKRTPAFGMQENVNRRDVSQEYLTSDYGLNYRWTMGGGWTLNADAQHVKSTVDNLDFGVNGATYANVSLDLTGSLPKIAFLPPSLTGAGADQASAYFSNPANYFWRSAMDHLEQSEGKEDTLRLDLERKFEDSNWIDSIRFGARGSRRDQTTRWSTYNWGVLSEIWGHGGPVWFDNSVNGAPTTTHTSLNTFPNFMQGGVAAPAAPYFNMNIVDNYAAAGQYLQAINQTWYPGNTSGWYPLAQRQVTDLIPGTPFRQNEVNHVLEDTFAGYMQVNFTHELSNGMKLGGNLGARLVQTQDTADGFLAYPVGSGYQEADCQALKPGTTTPFCSLTLAQRNAVRAFANGGSAALSTSNRYNDVLPSFNVKLGLTRDMLVRFGYSQAISRPDMGLLRNYTQIKEQDAPDPNNKGATIFSGWQADVGNPHLRPIRAQQFDLSYEWYFAPVGSVTVSTFYKELKDVITNGFRDVPQTNNGASFNVRVQGPVNSPATGRVKGTEIAYQQFYDFLPGPLAGIGLNLNYSYIESGGVPQVNLSSTDPNGPGIPEPSVNTGNLPLVGLSKHNANAALMYEKYGISGRLAYSWRSRYLLTVRDVIVPFAPIFADATGQLDASLSYGFNNHLKVGLEASNLLNEVTKTLQVLNDAALTAPRSYFINDRRFTVFMRANF